MSASNPTDRAAIGRIAAHESWANTPDKTARTAKARATMMAKFEQQVDPDRVMDPEERAEKAAAARKEHFSNLARRPRKTSRKKPKTQEEHAAAAADLRLARDEDRAALYHFLLDRIKEEEWAVEALSPQDHPGRRRESVTALRALVQRMRQDGADEYLRYLIVPYRDYPDCRAEWLL